jgi:hypothetical protein
LEEKKVFLVAKKKAKDQACAKGKQKISKITPYKAGD